MADHTKIEWATATWNPITGCTPISEGRRDVTDRFEQAAVEIIDDEEALVKK